MKKIAILILAFCIFSGCSIHKQQKPRTINISSGITDNGQSFSYKFDFDSDNTAEDIKMDIYCPGDNSFEDSHLNVSIGDYSANLEIIDGRIDAVYVCDIDSGDGVYDLAIITNEVSDDPRIRILNFNPSLTQYKFYSEYDEEIVDDNWLGYAVNYHFNVNDDSTITIEEQTSSYGMWSVYKTYQMDSSGIFKEVKPEKYKILPDFMDRDLDYFDEISSEEKDMWKKGYIMAHERYFGDGFTISQGAYIKPLYDDGNNNILVQTEGGKELWLNIEDDMSNFNMYFFYLAG